MPVNHEIFSEINSAQWLWYFYNFTEDENEKFKQNRTLVEYHASFIEPEAVRKIRESRDESIEVPHNEFTAGIEHFFGRDIPISKEKRKGSQSHNIDPRMAIQAAKNQIHPQIDYKYWLNFNLE